MRGPFIALLLLAFPLAEIAGFIFVGRHIGVFATIGLIILTGIAGSLLLRFQGIGIVSRIRTEMNAGRDPSRDLAHGVMIMLAGILLLIPGFLSDIVGLLLFIPPVRDLGWRFVRGRININSRMNTNINMKTSFGGGRKPRGNMIDLDEDDYTVSQPAKRPRRDIEDDR